jgi:hypothetical protein
MTLDGNAGENPASRLSPACSASCDAELDPPITAERGPGLEGPIDSVCTPGSRRRWRWPRSPSRIDSRRVGTGKELVARRLHDAGPALGAAVSWRSTARDPRDSARAGAYSERREARSTAPTVTNPGPPAERGGRHRALGRDRRHCLCRFKRSSFESCKNAASAPLAHSKSSRSTCVSYLPRTVTSHASSRRVDSGPI